jgi:hypothetical protein
VTAFEYRLHEVGPQVLAGGVVHAVADAPRVFPLWQWIGDDPATVFSY